MWGGARPAGMHSAVGLAATALILLLMLHQKAYGLPFVQKHFIAGTCDDPYW